MQIYKHRQTGRLTLIALGCGALLTAVLAVAVAPGPATAVVSIVFVTVLLALLIFSSLTVEVTSDRVTAWFGPGVFRKTFRVDSIRSAKLVRNHWYYGWGIRLTPHGWLFNVSGLDAVELQLNNDKKFRLGTDEPQQLLAAIQQALLNSNR